MLTNAEHAAPSHAMKPTCTAQQTETFPCFLCLGSLQKLLHGPTWESEVNEAHGSNEKKAKENTSPQIPCLVFINMSVSEGRPMLQAEELHLSHCRGRSTEYDFKRVIIIIIFPCSFSKQAEWWGSPPSPPLSFSFNTPPFHALTFISCHSLPLQCGLMYTGPSVSRPLARIQACSVPLTRRLPCECIICESCPIRIESVSC